MTELRSDLELSLIEHVERGNVFCSFLLPYWTSVNGLLECDYDIPQDLSHQLYFVRLMKFKVGCAERFAEMLDFGLQIDIDGIISKQIFNTICNYEHFDCLILLMVRGIEVFDVVDERIPLIHYISQYPKALPAIEYMFWLDPTLNDYSTFVGWVPLTYACRSGNLSVVQYLISKGANPLHIDLGKKTMLHHAVIQGTIELVDLLLSYGIQIDARDSNEKTALHHACERGNATLVNYLISRGADINAKDIINSTPVKSAYCKDQAAVMHLLLTRHKAKLHVINWREMFAGSASAQLVKEEYFHRMLAIPRYMGALFRTSELFR